MRRMITTLKIRPDLPGYTRRRALIGIGIGSISECWKALHSSENMCWQTPPAIWQGVLDRLGIDRFDLDPCSPGGDGPGAIPCTDRYTAADDGLSRSWGGAGSVAWVNPPYGRALSA